MEAGRLSWKRLHWWELLPQSLDSWGWLMVGVNALVLRQVMVVIELEKRTVQPLATATLAVESAIVMVAQKEIRLGQTDLATAVSMDLLRGIAWDSKDGLSVPVMDVLDTATGQG